MPSYHISGFLFHLKTQQILLHEIKNHNGKDNSVWTILTGEGRKKDPKIEFKQLAKKMLGVNLPEDSIFSVYDYIDKIDRKTHLVFYGLIPQIKEFKETKERQLSWFQFKKAFKLKFADQVKHDIIIAQRVINAHSREVELRLTPPVNVSPTL